MRLIYIMCAAWTAAILVLFVPIGCDGQRTMLANLLIGVIPVMIFVGVLRLRREP